MEGSNDDTSSSSELKQEEEELTFSLNHQLTYSPEISVFECSDNAEVKFRPSSPSEELLLLTEEQEEIEVTAEADLKGDAYKVCLDCGEALPLRNLRDHISTHHIEPGMSSCTQCNYKRIDTNDMLDHMTTHYDFKSYACTFNNCGKAFHLRHSLTRHMTERHSRGRLRAVAKRSPRKNAPRNKKKTDSDAVTCFCITCGEGMRAPELYFHIMTHLRPGQYKCDLCGLEYVNRETLREHMNTHYGLEPHQCAICRKTYSLKQSLINHIIRTHKAIKPLEHYSCRYQNQIQQRKTMKTDSSKKSFLRISKSCQKTLSNAPFNHETIVSSSKRTKFQCQYCSYVFSTKFSVQRHEAKQHEPNRVVLNPDPNPPENRTHTAIKPLTDRYQTQKRKAMKTDSSKKSFLRISKSCQKMLSNAPVSSSKRAKFQCQYCSRVFSTKFSVQRHEAKQHEPNRVGLTPDPNPQEDPTSSSYILGI